MKRYGHLIEKIIEESNLLEAFSMVMRGKKRSRTVRYFKKNRDKILADLAEEIKSGKYAPEGFREFEVVENGKVREIQSLPFKDRIALHAIMAVLYRDVLGGMMIRDTYASLPKRGIHDGLNRLRKETFYNTVRKCSYDLCFDYLDGLEVVSCDYRELFNKYKDIPNVVFLIDPPYLSTEVGTYTMDWGLSDYLDVLQTLVGTNYIYFTSNKSSIIELCEWMGRNNAIGNPFAGGEKIEFNAHEL